MVRKIPAMMERGRGMMGMGMEVRAGATGNKNKSKEKEEEKETQRNSTQTGSSGINLENLWAEHEWGRTEGDQRSIICYHQDGGEE